MADLESGVGYFELEEYKQDNHHQSQNKLQKQYEKSYINKFYWALVVQMVFIYFICDAFYSNIDMRNIALSNPCIIIILFILQFGLLYLLNTETNQNQAVLPFYIIFTLVEGCLISLFFNYFPEVAYFSLILTILILIILLIISYVANIEEQGISLTFSILIFLLVFIILLGLNHQNLFHIIFGALLSLPFCFYTIYKVSNMTESDFNIGFLLFSLKIYLYFLQSCINQLCQCCQGCCDSNNGCQFTGCYDCNLDCTNDNHTSSHDCNCCNNSNNGNCDCTCDCNCDGSPDCSCNC